MAPAKLAIALTVLLVGIAASTQVATATMFGAEEYPAELSGEPDEAISFGTEAGSIKCEGPDLEGSLAGAYGTLALTPALSECTLGFSAATITVNGCHLVVVPDEEFGSTTEGTMDVVCPEGKTIVIVAGNCEVKIDDQTGLTSLTIANEATSPETVAVTFEVTGLDYTVTKDGFLCPFSGTGLRTTGTLAGTALLGATAESGAVGLFAMPEAVLVCVGLSEEEECTQDKQEKDRFLVKASAPSAKIELGGTNVDCQEAKFEVEVWGHLGNGKLVGVGKELKFDVKNCKTAKVANCNPVSSEAPFLSLFGLNEWIGTLIDLKIVCGAEIFCKYSHANAPMPLTPGAGAKITANKTPLQRENLAGEAGCPEEAKLTATFTVTTPNPLHFNVKKK